MFESTKPIGVTISLNHKDADFMLVDCIALADNTFLGCRVGMSQSGDFLGILVEVFAKVRECGTLLVEMPDSQLASAEATFPDLRMQEEAELMQVAQLPPEKQELLWFLESAAKELQRLWLARAERATQSLGYAVHPLCTLIQSSEAFEPKMFQFNFRVAAGHWSELSADMQQALCNLIGIEQAEADRLVAQGNFAIDMYGRGQN